jgi:curved DNA-binding protein CbpA
MNNIKQYYEILGLKPGALEAEVKQAYRHMAKTWHPDRFTDNPQLKQKAEEKIKKINEAYQKLKSYQANSPNQTSHTGIYSTNSSNAETYYRQGVDNLTTEKYKEAIAVATEYRQGNFYSYGAFRHSLFCCLQPGWKDASQW